MSPKLLPRPRAVDVGAVALTLSALALPATAAPRVDATSTTLLLSRPEIVGTTPRASAPLLELMDLSASGIDTPLGQDLRARVVAWGRWETLGTDGQALNGDVQLAYAEGSWAGRRVMLRAGRQLILEGTGMRALHVDGAFLDARIWRNFGVRVFGGAPVAPDFGPRPGDLITGARAYFAPSWGTEVGASYTFGLDRGLVSRHDVGVDGRWAVTPNLSANAYGSFSLAEQRLIELDIGPRWVVLPNLELWTAFRRTAPDLWLPRTSIFSVFAEERRDELGAGVYWEPWSQLGISADLRGLQNEYGDGYDAGARVSLGIGARSRTRVTAQFRQLRIPDHGYLQTRLGISQKIWRELTATADGDVYFLDAPINGQDRSYSATATLGWTFLPGWRAGVTAIGTTNPTWESRLEVLAKLTYNFSSLDGGGR